MQALTQKSACLINLMFSEPSVMKELIDSSEHNLWSKISVDTETCEVVLGKTRCGWWNRLIGAEKRISLHEFAFKMIGILSARAGKSQNSALIAKGLAEDIIDALVREGRSNDIIDRLFLVGYLGVKTAWSCSSLTTEGFVGGKKDDVDVNLKVNDERHTFVLPGSGDPIFEIAIGAKSVRMLNRG